MGATNFSGQETSSTIWSTVFSDLPCGFTWLHNCDTTKVECCQGEQEKAMKHLRRVIPNANNLDCVIRCFFFSEMEVYLVYAISCLDSFVPKLYTVQLIRKLVSKVFISFRVPIINNAWRYCRHYIIQT
ncbi:hypothetical protein RND81_02G046500 [Saponaria officinalis]|uniref:Uncharacterized protein n=1 Tax=Saponaria officinalis TaxID=3572 RepID=A0AAW1MKK2_SAPOF